MKEDEHAKVTKVNPNKNGDGHVHGELKPLGIMNGLQEVKTT